MHPTGVARPALRTQIRLLLASMEPDKEKRRAGVSLGDEAEASRVAIAFTLNSERQPTVVAMALVAIQSLVLKPPVDSDIAQDVLCVSRF